VRRTRKPYSWVIEWEIIEALTDEQVFCTCTGTLHDWSILSLQASNALGAIVGKVQS